MGWFNGILTVWEKRAHRQAAQEEVRTLLRKHPIEGYGLYHVLKDAGLLSRAAISQLEPLIGSIEARMSLDKHDQRIKLPLLFEPITDQEQDTLTALLGQALRAFIEALPQQQQQQRLEALLDVLALLEQHTHHTASLAFEIALGDLLEPLLRYFSRAISYSKQGQVNIDVGDFFKLTDPVRSGFVYPTGYLAERRLEENAFVRVKEVWERGYVLAERLVGQSRYTRAWSIGRIPYRKLPRLPEDNHLVVVHEKEGKFYRVEGRYESGLARLIELYRLHEVDRSVDATLYQPRRPEDV